ncbi:MAG TPA: dephospho-CoA kinase [Ignavibacteria bacterium]|nr:dephospho-CoA kinase [Ignavibacteria bacterium]
MKNKKKLVIGITGGIGSGKTEVCKLLAKRGFKVFYSDLVAKNLYLTDKKLAGNIVRVFGKDILNYKGKINLPKLREKIFASKKNYMAINKIVHPVVISYLNKEARKSKFDITVIESALLFESGFNKDLDYIVTVYSNKKNRVSRLILRDEASRNDINDLMKFQIDDKSKMSMSDFVLINNKTLKDLKIQVDFLSTVLNAMIS